MIRAIFFDIDGTLVSFNTHTIPQSTIEAISILKEKGIKVFIATGRPFITIDNLGGIEFDAFITLNGGYCLTGKKEIIYKSRIPVSNIQSLIKQNIESERFPCMAATKDRVYINYIDDKVKQIVKLLNFPLPAIKSFEEIIEDEIFQLMAFVDEEKEKFVMKDILPDCEAARWNPLFTDIIAKGNSKQTGMDKLLDYYGIPLSDTMAFGDGGNDIPMLKHAATSVAMGNAKDEVKQYASYITNSVDDNGIWNALKHFSII
ncbi:Cof-type HAD-IIB family hydrolase [Dysgonomonas sp. 216]|uniref:Cof-type HAD-IIB family hydrolase n=1 Tax=Dysgonomonas sp. 216 TaxID=2302934 RepID=UPI0013CFFBED|nr:Cof-type HAD-IIB family hydrolase [Dysgonomonas sp. 216]NDW18823.1 Cof-type HAD-IIB family hydrolase [Dysgonomonas sp. 216]